jgi:hypothetical protein
VSIDRADKIVSLLGELTRADIGALPPAERRRLLEALEEAHRIATTETIFADAREAMAPKTGILHDLTKDGRSRT